MTELQGIVQVEDLDNFGDERREVGLGSFGVGWQVQVAECLGGDRAYGDAEDLLWKTHAGSFK